MKKIRIFSVIMAAAVVLLAADCNGSVLPEESENSESPEWNPDNNPWTEGEDLSGQSLVIHGIAQDPGGTLESLEYFESITGISVTYEYVADIEQELYIKAAAGELPDVLMLAQPGITRDLARQGYIEDISDWFAEGALEESFLPGIAELGMVDGSAFAIPVGIGIKSLVWYVPEIFDDRNYDIPESWDDLLALSEQMVADGFTPWSVGLESGGASGWPGTDWIEDIMLRTASPETYDDWVAGELKFDSEEIRNAFTLLDEIWSGEDFVLGGAAGMVETSFHQAGNVLLEDPPAALMNRMASFLPGFFPEGTELGSDIDFFYLPPIDTEYGSPLLISGDLFVACNDRPAVRAFMRYFSDAISMKPLVQNGELSVHAGVERDWYTEFNQRYVDLLDAADSFRFDASDMMPPEVGVGTFWQGMLDFAANPENLDAILNVIDESWPEESE